MTDITTNEVQQDARATQLAGTSWLTRPGMRWIVIGWAFSGCTAAALLIIMLSSPNPLEMAQSIIIGLFSIISCLFVAFLSVRD